MPAVVDLHSGWKACRASDVAASGQTISIPSFDTSAWRDAVVPGTVLATLLQDRDWLAAHLPAEVLELPQNRASFDPFFHLNLKHLPDLGDRALPGEPFRKGRGRGFYTYWFRTQFRLEPDQQAADLLWLHLRGINYTATVFLNGCQLAGTPYRGMFRRRTFAVTDLIDRTGVNALAVLVEPLDHPGLCNGINGSDGEIGRNVSMQYLAGWDWVPAVPDRNTGIWDRVELRATGPVRLQHPQVVTRVPGARRPDGPHQAPAHLTVVVELENATPLPQRGWLRGDLEDLTFAQEVRLDPGETRSLRFTSATFPQLEIRNPRLWWPNGCGPQELYDLQLSFTTADDRLSDAESLRFGIREIHSAVPLRMERIFWVNGRPIFIRGGNWVGTDALLRLSPKRYRDEVRLHQEMGLNMIRIWGGAIAERPEFYDACDACGILVMQDFWITGDGNGAWDDPTKYSQEVRRRYPDDHDLFLACARDTIRLLRNHPSLCFWCGGNEIPPWGYAAGEQPPPADLNGALAQYIGDHPGALDPTRVYVPGSADARYVGFDGDGLHGHGPYRYQEPEHYYTIARGFTTEIGTAALPPAESLRAMIAAEDLFPGGRPGWGTLGWQFHDEQDADTYGFAIAQYGPARDLDDFGLKAQLVNYKSYQGIFEAWNARLWNNCSGLLIWKSQNCWPNLRSQLYDWYLEPTGGYFATRRACAPIHVQLDLATWRVGVCNTTCWPLADLAATATFFALDGRPYPGLSVTVSLPPETYTPLFPLTRPRALSTVHFLKLELRDASGALVADNLYWFSRQKATTPNRYAALEQLRAPDRQVALETSLKTGPQDDQHLFRATLRNPTAHVAFCTRLQLRRADGQTRVLPTFYGDNYFTLFPGEEKTVAITCAREDAGDPPPRLFATGWNILPAEIR